MKRSQGWKSGGRSTGSICCGSTGAGRISIGGKRSRRTCVLSRIRPPCVRGLLSHNDSDPLQRHEGPQGILTNEEIDTKTNIEETALLRHRFSIFLKNLSYDEIRIFEYFFIEEEKDKEKIIKELGISQATFYRRLEGIKQKFRHFVANNGVM